jgi:CubicO group peptidase (beta-lactamase class C family)
MLWYNSSLNGKEMAEKIKHLPLDTPFRTSFLYNNLMYVTMETIVETITNQTWKQYVTENILQPLLMEKTNFSVTNVQNTTNYAHPHVEKDGEIIEISFHNVDNVGAAGCINSTIEDMAKWLLLHLNLGKIENHQLLSAELLQQMYIPHNVIPVESPFSMHESPVNSYGLGWFISSYRGHKTIHHNGTTDGFSSFVSFMLEEGVGVIILTNVWNSLLPTYMTNQIYDELLELQPIDWYKRAVDDTAMFKEMVDEVYQYLPPQVSNTTPSHPLENFIGTFEHPAYGILEVYKINNDLHIKFLDIDTPLTHYHYNMFYSTFDWMQNEMNILLTYQMDTEGNFQEAQLHLSMLLSLEPITFTRVN